jgi:Glu-tRNA(Gln) amidotransferase subunit E-like FAD-binding protein
VFDQVVVRRKALSPKRAAMILCGHRRAANRAGIRFDGIPHGAMIDALTMLGRREVFWPGFVELLVRLADAAERGVEDPAATDARTVVEKARLAPAGEEEIDSLVARMMEGWRGGSGVDPDAAHRALTGGVVYALGARADGATISAKMKKALSEPRPR